ncbi:patched domain-containing protein 3-like [Centruroides vittatus]|uniref:patched domain-containing protein 3-like n=1 Tax=Centruroides vittatus TaxID=120091 RepID=UPI0035103CF0
MTKNIKSSFTCWISRIGYHIGCHPQLYIYVFLLITIVLSTGFFKLRIVQKTEYLYSPIDGRGQAERNSVESIFSYNTTTNFDFSKASRLDNMGMFIAVSKNDSLLNDNAISELVKLDDIIRNISIFWNNSFFRYEDLCPRNKQNRCPSNFLSYLIRKFEEFKRGRSFMRYPYERNMFELRLPVMYIGGVSTNDDGYVQDFKAFRLLYFLDCDSTDQKQLAIKWENAFLNTLSDVKLQHIELYMFTGQTVDVEANRNTELSLPLLLVSGVIMTSFSFVSCLTFDAVSSKPLVGIAAYFSPLLGTAAAFGLLLHCNVEYVDMNVAVAFLTIGIGMDDSFVLLAAWRRTNKNYSIPQRLSETFSDVCISITMTSLTNFISFMLGVITPYRNIRIFSIYSAISVLFDYMYQIFFFGAVMAIDGYREKHNLHSLFLYPVRNNVAERKSSNIQNILNVLKIMLSIPKKLGNFLCRKMTKILVLLSFIFLLAGAIYNINSMKQGYDFVNCFPFNSFAHKFVKVHYQYFTDYPCRVQIVFNQTLDYSNPTVQMDIENILKTFESAPYMTGSNFTECWLREYLSYIRDSRINYLIKDFDVNTTQGFLEGLKKVFLKFHNGIFEGDIVWNKERDQIVASRCLLTYRNVRSGSDEKFLIEQLRKIAADSKYDVFVYNLWFVFYDQYLNMPEIYLKAMGIAVVSVFVIFLAFISDISYSIAVLFMVICIQVEALGYGSAWNVSLNLFSVIFLIMSAGFCVDYSVHIAHAYKNCKETDPNEKIKASLQCIGYPIVQGCLSTLIGAILCIFGLFYMLILFFKIMVLVMIFSMFNGLIVLPVILSIIDSIHIPWMKKLNIVSSP